MEASTSYQAEIAAGNFVVKLSVTQKGGGRIPFNTLTSDQLASISHRLAGEVSTLMPYERNNSQ